MLVNEIIITIMIPETAIGGRFLTPGLNGLEAGADQRDLGTHSPAQAHKLLLPFPTV